MHDMILRNQVVEIVEVSRFDMFSWSPWVWILMIDSQHLPVGDCYLQIQVVFHEDFVNTSPLLLRSLAGWQGVKTYGRHVALFLKDGR